VIRHVPLMSIPWSRLLVCMALMTAAVVRLQAQESNDPIKPYIDKLNKGQAQEVKQELPQLVAKYQNDPGVLYLQGRLASDGVEAMKSYQSIVDNFPKSEWADDALYRIYQYYYALGLYRTAELKRQQLQQQYPNSPFLAADSKSSLPKEDEIAVNLHTKEPVVSSTEAPPTRPETTAVSVESPKAKVTESVEPYTLQVGAFSAVANAEKQKNFFEESGFSVEITNKVRNGKSLYLVWVGSFKTADEAKQSARRVKAKYKIDSIVIERY
jgi:cell division protein FtsN